MPLASAARPRSGDLRQILLRIAGYIAAMLSTAAALVTADEPSSLFERVSEILVTRCLECHNAREASGGLDLSRATSTFGGGDSGRVVTPNDPSGSLLWQRVSQGEMPPMRQGKPQPLSPESIALIESWIAAGAEWPENRVLDLYERTSQVRAGRDWWSLQPVVRPRIPDTSTRLVSRNNSIDIFIQAALSDAHLSPAQPAEPRVWLRRVTYATTGLAPTLEDYARIEADAGPDARSREIDRLLASPRFGERFARFWLDLVRYADTSGYERDQEKPFAWRYRDWVVDSFNSDKPYDQFVVEQLAGDQLETANEQSVLGTGFLRLGTWNDEPNDPDEYQYERLEDLVHVTSTAFLGLTVKCARCHDHKFDPIPQRDYYQLAAAFWPGPIAARGRELLGGPDATELGFDRVLGWTDVRRDGPPLHLLVKGDYRREGPIAHFAPLSALQGLSCEIPRDGSLDTSNSGARRALAKWIVDPHNPLTARVMVNRIWQFYFGTGLVRSTNNFGFRGDPPSHPELLDYLAAELVEHGWQLKPIHRLLLSSATFAQSNEHLQLAEYTQLDAGNRWLWHHNRQRLDAEGLRDAILQASDELDLRLGGPGFLPELNAEALEGLSRKSAAWQPSPPSDQRRRSLYLFSQRSLLFPWMTTFDFVDTTTPCGQRDVTTVAPQALALLNSPLIHQQSQMLANRLYRQALGSHADPVQLAFQATLRRFPTPTELAAAQKYVRSQSEHFQITLARHAAISESLQDTSTSLTAESAALQSLCQVLMSSNEFLYVD